MPLNTVKSQLQRALAMLRQKLAGIRTGGSRQWIDLTKTALKKNSAVRCSVRNLTTTSKVA